MEADQVELSEPCFHLLNMVLVPSSMILQMKEAGHSRKYSATQALAAASQNVLGAVQKTLTKERPQKVALATPILRKWRKGI